VSLLVEEQEAGQHRQSTNTIQQMVLGDINVEKYDAALQILNEYVLKRGYRFLARICEPISDYNVIIAPFPYRWRTEILIAQIVSELRGWSNARVAKLTQLLVQHDDILKKFGHPLSQVAYLLENARARFEVEETERRGGRFEGGLEAGVARVGGMASVESETKTLQSMTGSARTLRYAVRAVLEAVEKPTILVLSDYEVDVLGAETILDSVVGNQNLVILVYLPTRPSPEFVKIVLSDRTTSLNLPISFARMKSMVVNMYIDAGKNIGNGFFRQETRAGVSDTIKLLTETGVLQHAAGVIAYRLPNPVMIKEAMNKFIALFYGHMERRASTLLDFYKVLDPGQQQKFSQALVTAARPLEYKAIGGTVDEYLDIRAVDVITRMLGYLNVPHDVIARFLQDLEDYVPYPSTYPYQLVEYARMLGIAYVKYTRTRRVLVPGLRLYTAARMFVERQLARNRSRT